MPDLKHGAVVMSRMRSSPRIGFPWDGLTNRLSSFRSRAAGERHRNSTTTYGSTRGHRASERDSNRSVRGHLSIIDASHRDGTFVPLRSRCVRQGKDRRRPSRMCDSMCRQFRRLSRFKPENTGVRRRLARRRPIPENAPFGVLLPPIPRSSSVSASASVSVHEIIPPESLPGPEYDPDPTPGPRRRLRLLLLPRCSSSSSPSPFPSSVSSGT